MVGNIMYMLHIICIYCIYMLVANLGAAVAHPYAHPFDLGHKCPWRGHINIPSIFVSKILLLAGFPFLQISA